MLILHESLPMEARSIAKALRQVYRVPIQIAPADLNSCFQPIPEFKGYGVSSEEILGTVGASFPNTSVLIVTPRDVYADNKSRNDDWIFGYCLGDINVVSTARMKRSDNQPSTELKIPLDDYLKRLATISIHEIGHDVVKAKHHQEATWVNVQNGHRLELGPHCTDNTCVMYEVVDIQTPPRTEGYMLLGKEHKHDAGLQDQIKRMRSTWFCDPCKASIHIDEKYSNRVSFK